MWRMLIFLLIPISVLYGRGSREENVVRPPPLPPALAPRIPHQHTYYFRENRFEGIKVRSEVGTTLPKLSFISATFTSDSLSGEKDNNARLGFFLEKTQEVKITVRYPSEYYWMECVTDETSRTVKYFAGYNEFDWPNNTIKFMNIDMDALYASAELLVQGTALTVAPIILYSAPNLQSEIEVTRYKISFIMDRRAIVNFQLLDPDKTKIEEEEIDVFKNNIFHFHWRPKADSPEGLYELVINLYYQNYQSLPDSKPSMLLFMHYNKLHVSPRK